MEEHHLSVFSIFVICFIISVKSFNSYLSSLDSDSGLTTVEILKSLYYPSSIDCGLRHVELNEAKIALSKKDIEQMIMKHGKNRKWKWKLPAFFVYHSNSDCNPGILSLESCAFDYISIGELVTKCGYPFEEHDVAAPDGAVSVLHRIPHGLKDNPNTKRIPVILFHGILLNSALFVFNTCNNSLAFTLAKDGYDVWMANQRGNTYSKNNKYTDKDSRYWDFSFQDSALIDTPLMIDYILEKTGHKKLMYIGMSMGSTIAFILLSTKPEYNEKIYALLCLSPVVYLKYSTSMLRVFMFIGYLQQKAIGNSGSRVYSLIINLVDFMIRICHRRELLNYFTGVLFTTTGDDITHLNKSRIPVFINGFPDKTSLRNIAYFWQLYRNAEFKMYDYENPEKNVQIYNQTTPPAFDLNRITVPVALYPAYSDKLGTLKDVQLISSKLRNLRHNVPLMNEKGCGHFSNVIGKKANINLFPRMLAFMKSILLEEKNQKNIESFHKIP